MINPFSFLRLIAEVRKLRRAVERYVDMYEIEWKDRQARTPYRGPRRMTEIASFDLKSSEDKWQEYLKDKGLVEDK